MNSRIDTVEELAAARAELGQIVGLLGDGLDELLDLKNRLEANARALETAAGEVEAAALAALCLDERPRPAAPRSRPPRPAN